MYYNKYFSPVSRWVLRKISNIPKFFILIGPWGAKGCEFTWYRGFFTRSPPHIARISQKTGLFSVIPIKHSTGHSGRNFHSIQKVFFSKCSSWCKLSKTDHVYYKIVLQSCRKRHFFSNFIIFFKKYFIKLIISWNFTGISKTGSHISKGYLISFHSRQSWPQSVRCSPSYVNLFIMKCTKYMNSIYSQICFQ